MKNFKSHFKFNKQERSGIFFLLLIVSILQGIFFYLQSRPFGFENEKIIINEVEQQRIDSLKKVATSKDTLRIYPFNPNFISDYKGYTLGMSVEEIDRLKAFRRSNEFVNSKEEFQKVTLVSDSLLHSISPYFKFPEWVKNKQRKAPTWTTHKTKKAYSLIVKDLNLVTAQDLRSINGIGDKLSARIIKFRDRLGGFLVNEQLYDVYGLEANVVEKTLKHFKVLNAPTIEPININSASAQELAGLVYISYGVATKIVEFREFQGAFISFNELTKVDDFPSEKLDRIALYLSL